jgi:hypothetical protein
VTAVRASAADHEVGRRHDFDRVDDEGDVFVLCCMCGWKTPPSRSAEVVGTAWDRHRKDVRAVDENQEHRETS